MPSKAVATSSKKPSGAKASGAKASGAKASVSRGVLRKQAPAKTSVGTERWFGANPIRLWRETHDPHMTRVDLARLVGVSYVSIGNWERGIAFPFGKSLEMLKEAIRDDEIGKRLYAWMKRGNAT